MTVFRFKIFCLLYPLFFIPFLICLYFKKSLAFIWLSRLCYDTFTFLIILCNNGTISLYICHLTWLLYEYITIVLLMISFNKVENRARHLAILIFKILYFFSQLLWSSFFIFFPSCWKYWDNPVICSYIKHQISPLICFLLILATAA